MCLRSNEGNSQEHVRSQLALNCQVVLLRILCPQVRLEFTKEQNGTEQVTNPRSLWDPRDRNRGYWASG